MARHQKIINETKESDRLKEMMDFLYSEFTSIKNKIDKDKEDINKSYDDNIRRSIDIIKAFEFLTRNCSTPKENDNGKKKENETPTEFLLRNKKS
jgi:hypothetical protein